MSGIFLVVEAEGTSPDTSFLRPTKGGYPHITFVYTGKSMELARLNGTAILLLVHLVAGTDELATYTLDAAHAHVNSFRVGSTGEMRHDVLLGLSATDAGRIEHMRDTFLPADKRAEFSTNPPHVTHSIHDNKEDAEKALADLRSQNVFPVRVRITGVTVD